MRVDTAALSDMQDALSKRGLSLKVTLAGQGHEHAPSHCLYIDADSAPLLSYDDAISRINARLPEWRINPPTCSQCGACFKCLRKAGILDSM